MAEGERSVVGLQFAGSAEETSIPTSTGHLQLGDPKHVSPPTIVYPECITITQGRREEAALGHEGVPRVNDVPGKSTMSFCDHSRAHSVTTPEPCAKVTSGQNGEMLA